MRKTCIRISLVTACAFAVFGQASAGTINFWFNRASDSITTTASNYAVSAGQNDFNVYVNYSGFTNNGSGPGALTDLGFLFGYATSTTSGLSATPGASNSSFVSFTWSSIFASNEFSHGLAGGGGPASGTTRPYGFNDVAVALTGSIAGTDNNLNLLVGTVRLNVSPGVTNASVWSFANTDSFASVAADLNGAESFPTTPFNATITAAPEPASMIALGLGAAALIRRRRSK